MTTFMESRRTSLEGLLHDIYDDWNDASYDLDTETLTDTSVSNFSDYQSLSVQSNTRRLSASKRRSIFAQRLGPGSAPSAYPPLTGSIDDESGTIPRYDKETLMDMDLFQLSQLIIRLRTEVASASLLLIKYLKRREHQISRMKARCNVMTAILQAMSPKRSVDAKLQFTLDPPVGENGYEQWLNAMRSVARLPDGMPNHFRKRLWLTLADHYVKSANVDWEDTSRRAFNDRINDDDDELSLQIVKDLHRTGWSGLSGDVERVLLKRVLLAYARYNKTIGYCQGFNVIAALILEIMEYHEEPTLKVMIMLIENVLPSGYFDQTLRALSVDMAVLRDLVHQRLPRLSAHLDHLQMSSESEFEPPLTNVFSMQWFLTLFATCLPKQAVFRIWDSLMLEGSEISLRVALAIWAKIGKRIYKAKSADSYYTLMGTISQELLHMNNDQCNELMDVIYSMADFPYPGLSELRDRYTWNIQPFSSAFRLLRQQVVSILKSDDENGSESLSSSPRHSSSNSRGSLTPPAQNGGRVSSSQPSGSASDLSKLEKQYKLMRQRQKQAAIILQNALASSNGGRFSNNSRPMIPSFKNGTANSKPSHNPNSNGDIFNHLYVKKEPGQTITTSTLNGTFSVAPRAIQPSGQVVKPRHINPNVPSKSQDSNKVSSRRHKSDDSTTSTEVSTVMPPSSPGRSIETGSISTPTSSGGGSTPGLWTPLNLTSTFNWTTSTNTQINGNKQRRGSAGDILKPSLENESIRRWHSCSEMSIITEIPKSPISMYECQRSARHSTNNCHPSVSPGPTIPSRTKQYKRPPPLNLTSLTNGNGPRSNSSISNRIQPTTKTTPTFSAPTNDVATTAAIFPTSANGLASGGAHAAMLKKSKAILASASSQEDDDQSEQRRPNSAIRNPFPVKRQTALIERGKRLGLYS